MTQAAQSYRMRVGDIVYSIRNSIPGMNLTLESFWEPFLTSEDVNHDIEICVKPESECSPSKCREIFRARDERNLPNFGNPEDLFRVFQAGRGYLIETGGKTGDTSSRRTATFDTEGDLWDVFLPSGGHANSNSAVDALPLPLGLFITSYVTARRDGLTLHASGVNWEGMGLLFCGRSGIGKTTMTGLWAERGASIMSEDRMILRRIDGDFFVFNAPRLEECFEYGRAPLSGVFLLKQSLTNYLRRIDKTMAAARLMASCFQDYCERDTIEHHLMLLSDLVQKRTVYELGFAPDPRVVELVQQFLSGGVDVHATS